MQLDKPHIMNVMQLQALMQVFNFPVYTKVCYTLHHAFQRYVYQYPITMFPNMNQVWFLLPTCKKKAWK